MRIDPEDVSALMEAVNAHLSAAHRLRLLGDAEMVLRTRVQMNVANTLNDLSKVYLRAVERRKKASAVSEGLRGNPR
ncbi:MAG: hypothetical protein EOO77_22120 [Oxalobacteraceae bacterium]|jgi:acetyl-CoA carboxylase beta subunit|nr:MAG: hypothetical protein EOO77_22120 [Oxalobacteraceae bacterium]